MTLLRLGTPFRKLKKAVDRLFCGVLAALVLFASVTAPARAAAGTLAAISGAVVIASFLMASGIYPFVTEDGQSFGEWGAGQLRDLWNSYIDSFSDGQTPSGGTKETFDKISGFVTGKTIAIAKGFWSELRAFANWIVSEFSVADNQTGVQLGVISSNGSLPVFSSLPSYDVLLAEGFPFGTQTGYNNMVAGASAEGVYIFRASNVPYNWYFLASLSVPSSTQCYMGYYGRSYFVNYGSLSNTIVIDNVTYRISGVWGASGIHDMDTFDSLPVYPTDVSNTFGNVTPDFRGVIADTTTVSVPAELPEGTKFGGLTVPDALTSSAPAITDVIEQGVTDRTQPAVIPTTVDIPADIEITDDGIITENPVTVTPEMALPSVADLSLPASVIASFKTKFPFCLPWDVMAFFQPLSVTPQAPVIRCGLPDPFTGKTYEIVVDLSPWDGVAAIVRHFESVIIAVGFALGFRKFVLIGSHS